MFSRIYFMRVKILSVSFQRVNLLNISCQRVTILSVIFIHVICLIVCRQRVKNLLTAQKEAWLIS